MSQRKAPGTEPGLLGKTRARLFRLLSAVDTYDTIALLQRLEPSPLYEECVLIYGKANMHTQALRCLAFKLRDHAAAEQYCLEHCEPSSSETPTVPLRFAMFASAGSTAKDSVATATATSATATAAAAAAAAGTGSWGVSSSSRHYNPLFCELVNIYLHPPQGEPLRQQAMDVLRRHARFIDAGQVRSALCVRAVAGRCFVMVFRARVGEDEHRGKRSVQGEKRRCSPVGVGSRG